MRMYPELTLADCMWKRLCDRVVNYSDLIPLLPPCPYEHVGAAIYINSGGPGALWRHSLYAYRQGLRRLVG
ncbi:hypothetical protein A9X03_02710 [Mycobacterium sp. E1715]|nr:hypothetical protein A5704_23960 [Mycobacterium sp. E735]OBG67525.1 hypothetical protein A5703_11715 [Mycobacterium sp. E188]OBG97047.1 hypothetical protein A9X05_05940 [Mycobacterium sp. E3298]OBH13618.1 hypothetical protein A9X03_02710 [Mycobacterium sp. E1715]OBH34851.1 hypothetical protein A5691_07440 [Mycobacterium sp. E183]